MPKPTYHKFVKVSHPDHLQSWFLGYSPHHQQFVSWSDSAYGPGLFKQMDTVEELRSLYKWFMSKGYELITTYHDNINAMAC